MIYIQELRVGNWYKDAGCGITQMTPEKFDLWRGEFASPIPITPFILLACGFVFDVVSTHEYKQFNLITTSTDYILDEEFEITITSNNHDDGVAINHKAKSGIKFLHELQNLYYSLRGKELEYKPTKGGI